MLGGDETRSIGMNGRRNTFGLDCSGWGEGAEKEVEMETGWQMQSI